jgi:hypothetical protein
MAVQLQLTPKISGICAVILQRLYQMQSDLLCCINSPLNVLFGESPANSAGRFLAMRNCVSMFDKFADYC